MNTKLLEFLESCSKSNITTDDLGYITRWAFKFNGDTDKFFNKVKESIDSNFFDCPSRIKSIYDYHTNPNGVLVTM